MISAFFFQWLQVDFENAVKIVRVSTQGRQNANWWVKTYILSSGLDGVFFEEYQINGETKVSEVSRFFAILKRCRQCFSSYLTSTKIRAVLISAQLSIRTI